MKLDLDAARIAPSTRSPTRSASSKLDAAEGVLTVINSNMANAIRSRTVQKGIDPRGFSLVAFGGAGPLHGAEVAAMLEHPRGDRAALSRASPRRMGLLTTDLKYDTIRTEFQVSGRSTSTRLNADFAAMEARLPSNSPPTPRRRTRSRSPARPICATSARATSCAWRLPAGAIDAAGLEDVWQPLPRGAPAQSTASASPSSPIEIVNIRVSGVGRMPKIDTLGAPRGTTLDRPRSRPADACSASTASCEPLDTVFYRRHLLPVGEIIAGPAIVLQEDSTTVIPPGSSAPADAAGNLLIAIGGSHERRRLPRPARRRGGASIPSRPA